MPDKSGGWFRRKELSSFLEPHPYFAETEERIFTPREGLTITFYFEGGIAIKGDATDLQINFNSDPLVIITQSRGKISAVTRFAWSRFMGFELSWLTQEDDSRKKKPRLFVVPGIASADAKS